MDLLQEVFIELGLRGCDCLSSEHLTSARPRGAPIAYATLHLSGKHDFPTHQMQCLLQLLPQLTVHTPQAQQVRLQHEEALGILMKASGLQHLGLLI